MNEYQVGAIIGSLLIGVFTGLVPLILGVIKKKIGLAVGGFFACVVSGFILGIILAAPVAAVFSFLIMKKSNAELLEQQNQQFPNQQFPNQQAPNQQFPNQQFPNQQVPNQQAPNQQFPNQQFPNQQFPNQQFPNQQAPNQQFPNQQFQNQQVPNQQAPDQSYEGHQDSSPQNQENSQFPED